eukprot:PhF_6_TR30569/c0_g1_i3/m.44922
MSLSIASLLFFYLLSVVVADVPSSRSTLSCDGIDTARPDSFVTCTITALDSLGYATTATATTYAITTSGQGVTLGTTNPIMGGAQVIFVLRFSTPGEVSVTVAVGQSPISGSGLKFHVLAYPVVRFDNTLCAHSSVPLRGTLNCSAMAYGEGDHPAYVDPKDVDVFVTPEGIGSVRVLPSSVRVVIIYTAPTSVDVLPPDGVTILVKAKRSSWAGKTTPSFKLEYPLIPADENSELKCSGSGKGTYCTVTASDSQGPVRMNVEDFGVSFDPPDTNPLMKSTWLPGFSSRQARLTFDSIRNDKVFTCKMNVFVMRTAFNIQGSPFEVTEGVIPQASGVSLESCYPSPFITPGGTANCTLSVSMDMSADSKYIKVSATQGTVSPLKYYSTPSGTHGLNFIFTAPKEVTSRKDIILSIKVNDVQLTTTRHFIVYADKVTVDYSTVGSTKDMTSIVVVGAVCFFGLITVALVAVAFKKRRQAQLLKGQRSPARHSH